MIEREGRSDTLGVAGVPVVVVEECVDVVALGKHPAVLVQPVDLLHGPLVPLVVVTVEHPVDRDVGPDLR